MSTELWSGIGMVTLGMGAHALVVRGRRPFVGWAEGVAGPVVRGVVAVVDVVVGLICVAFFAVLLPVHGGPVDEGGALDALAAFALVVAAMESVSLMIVHRVAQILEPWPAGAEAAA